MLGCFAVLDGILKLLYCYLSFKWVTLRVLELSVLELLHFGKVNQKFISFIGLLESPKAPKAELISDRVFSKRILTSAESEFI